MDKRCLPEAVDQQTARSAEGLYIATEVATSQRAISAREHVRLRDHPLRTSLVEQGQFVRFANRSRRRSTQSLHRR